MTLWQLLIGLCLTMPLAFALEAAKSANVPIRGYALATVSGLAVGFICSGTMWRVGRAIWKRFSGNTMSLPITSLVCLAALAWIAFAGWLGERLVLALLSSVG
jgi:hypothetical protein